MKTNNENRRFERSLDVLAYLHGRIRLPKVLAIAALALAAFAGPAQATDYRGQFTLPSPTQWGSAVLSPGTYSFSFNTDKAPYMLKVQRGNETAVFIWPTGKTPLKGPAVASSLTAIRRGGKLRIRSLFLASEGAVFNFSLPKGEQPSIAERPELIQRIPILMAER